MLTIKDKLKDKMPAIYARLIKAGEKTIDDVPAELKDSVNLLIHPSASSKTLTNK